VKGLLLTLGGAPNTPHVIEGLPGYYYPETPHIVGDGDLTVEAAEQAVSNHPDLLKLVEVPVGEVAGAEATQAAQVEDGREAIAEARRDGRAGDDPSRTVDEINAVKEAS
jgi:hypothetical protein